MSKPIKPKVGKDKPFHFGGFTSPRYTPVPDEVFDVIMPRLFEAEFKVLMYVIRHTFGYKKDVDAISLSQLVDGITTRDGRVIDGGTGMSKSSVLRGIGGLIEKGILVKTTQPYKDGVQDTNVYSLRFAEEVVSQQDYTHPVVRPRVAPPQITQDSTLQKNKNDGLSEEDRRRADHAQWLIQQHGGDE